MGERDHYAPGTFCMVGLATSDPAGAARFYTSLFGWQAEELPAGPAGTFTVLRHRGRDVAILYRQMPEARAAGAPPHWTSYISVDDADATAARAGDLGGAAVFREPFDVLDQGRVAAIRDPAGAIVSLWQSRERIGATLVNDVGAWGWNELATPDVERVKTFFAGLLGWEYADGTIINAGRPNGSIREERGAEPAWLPYFTAENADDVAENARRLTPTMEFRNGRAAVVADPQGAAFGVFEGATDP
jgi:uncharacterized protein